MSMQRLPVNWWRVLALSLMALLVLAACGESESQTGPLPATTIPDVISTPTSDEASEPPDDTGGAGVETDSQLMQNVPGRPDTPAAEGEDFRADPASLVGNTGRPQLVEFFTYW